MICLDHSGSRKECDGTTAEGWRCVPLLLRGLETALFFVHDAIVTSRCFGDHFEISLRLRASWPLVLVGLLAVMQIALLMRYPYIRHCNLLHRDLGADMPPRGSASASRRVPILVAMCVEVAMPEALSRSPRGRLGIVCILAACECPCICFRGTRAGGTRAVGSLRVGAIDGCMMCSCGCVHDGCCGCVGFRAAGLPSYKYCC